MGKQMNIMPNSGNLMSPGQSLVQGIRSSSTQIPRIQEVPAKTESRPEAKPQTPKPAQNKGTESLFSTVQPNEVSNLMNQVKKMAEDSTASANDNPTGADINKLGLLPGQQLGQSAPKLEGLPTSLYAINNEVSQPPVTGGTEQVQTEASLPLAPPNPTFAPEQAPADPEANSQRLTLEELSADGDRSQGINDTLQVGDLKSAEKAPEMMAARQANELESTSNDGNKNYGPETLEAVKNQITRSTSYTFSPYDIENNPSGGNSVFNYNAELGISGAGKAPTAVFLSNQG